APETGVSSSGALLTCKAASFAEGLSIVFSMKYESPETLPAEVTGLGLIRCWKSWLILDKQKGTALNGLRYFF
ncbi:MAG: hypothetical protein AAGA76_06905, partial [Pseudomonadota bacterium]